ATADADDPSRAVESNDSPSGWCWRRSRFSAARSLLARSTSYLLLRALATTSPREQALVEKRTSRHQTGGHLPDRPASNDSNVPPFRALASRGHVELNLLSDTQRLVARALDAGVVNEDVVAAVTTDESVALLSVEELHGASSQCTLFSLVPFAIATN